MFGQLRGIFARGAEQPVKMICGLGNPGPSYAHTRHNTGYQVVETIAAAAGGKRPAWTVSRGLARFCVVDLDGTPVALMQPLTFMNLSGRAVRAVLGRFHLSPGDLLVVCDDMDLSCGAIRLRASGSAGGHRGVQSVIDLLGTREFARLRIGIGHPPEGEDTVKYVLSSPVPWDQSQQWNEVLDQAAAAAKLWMSAGLEAAMNRFNTNRPRKKVMGNES